jgi:hypothetical protein
MSHDEMERHMTLNEFLTQRIEGYLFEDLTRFEALPNEAQGDLGYPMLMTCFSGIEMLGALVSPKHLDFARDGHIRFFKYWKDFLYVNDPDRSKLGPRVYQLGRHGIAHTFAAKSGILVTRKPSDGHLVQVDEELLVNAVQLARDLRSSFDTRFKTFITGAGEEAATIVLKAFQDAYSSKAGATPGMLEPDVTIQTHMTSSVGG